jgi:predicted metal-dependent hydrolase
MIRQFGWRTESTASPEVYRSCPRNTMNISDDDKFHRGVSLFNAGDFFRAHEIWEELWLVESEPDKTFLQGLIQAAAAFHHYSQGNFSGAESLLASAATKLQRFPADHCGIRTSEFRTALIEWAKELGAGVDPGRDKLPRIIECS